MPIVLNQVAYAYPSHEGNIPALRDVCLQINDGECIGIMGHTGCGKSTLVQLIAGLLIPAAGHIYLDGQDINEKKYPRDTLRRDVGLVFQYPEYQLFETTVEKDVSFGLKHSGLSSSEIKERVRWALETMEFSYDAVRKQHPLSLSGGEKRRVAIAGALVTKPRFLIFDEPIAGLDPMSRKSFLQTVTRLHQKGTTVMMVSHNADALAECVQRLWVFDRGALVMDGSIKDIFARIDPLKALRLSPGTPRIIGHRLSSRGIAIPETAITYSELLSALKSWLTGGAPT